MNQANPKFNFKFWFEGIKIIMQLDTKPALFQSLRDLILVHNMLVDLKKKFLQVLDV